MRSTRCLLLLLGALCHAANNCAAIGDFHPLKILRPNLQGVRLRGGQNEAKTKIRPNGIWDAFRKVGRGVEQVEDDLPELRERKPYVWGQASSNRRTQEDVVLRVSCDRTALGEEVFCVGEREDDPGHKIKIRLETSGSTFPVWSCTTRLRPGKYKYKFAIEGGSPGERSLREHEELHGMWGVEDWRIITVLPVPRGESMLLMSDIDGTLVGDEKATLRFRETWRAEYQMRGCQLIYNTGRPFESARRLIAEGLLDIPDALVCSEGTEIYWFGPGGLDDVEADLEWRDMLMAAWEYPRLKAAMEAALQSHPELYSDVIFLPDINGQPLIVVKVHGRQEGVGLGKWLHKAVKDKHGLAYDLTASRNRGVWYLLMVPPGAGKGSAALHCSRCSGFPPHRVMVAGDGENDVPLFEYTKKGFKGTLVANVCNGLAQWARRRQGARVFRSRSSHALGVLEGLKHHFDAKSH